MRFVTISRAPRSATKITLAEAEKDEILISPRGERTIVLGIGPRAKLTRRRWLLLPRRMVRLAQEQRAREVSVDFRDLRFSHLALSDGEMAELLAVNALMANFAFNDFKTKPKGGFPRVTKVFLRHATSSDIERGVRKGQIIGEEVNRARHIATMPGGEMTPEILARHAEEAVSGLGVQVTVLGVPEMQKLGMGGVLAVGKGSEAKPKFIILEYHGAGAGEPPIVLVGKGITFDSGGLNLKPTDAILGMNMDMSGAAAVIHALSISARLKLKKNIVALVPAAENMLSGESYRPGDIVRSLSGKTIEIQNTDAEGRVVLADALAYAKRYRPALVVCVATLTGAVMVALGERAAGLFTDDERLETELRHMGEAVGDFVWPLPLWDDYFEDIKGTYGDIGNVGNTKWGGAITAAVFLKQFATGYRFVHVDIGSRMTSIAGEHLAKGAAGAGVRLLARYLEQGTTL